ncbi:MAG: 1-deoxy-D-xylulose-5-phosphate synthase [Bacillota bacterium]|nr:1-deoxy-D-xylulose-5-phosphate synthase [Bacillota bacterium]
MGGLLEGINSPADVKKLDITELTELSDEIREYLIENVSKTGGHLASNLGVVELTLALHKVFNTPDDRIVWDVGHQSYVHKIITGRREKFCTLRQHEGIAGFPKRNESEHDCFDTGHSSTSISAALGFARARDIKDEKYEVIAVIGDGALTGGMAFEALNDAGRSTNKMIVILNDNEMSISKNVGGMSRYLSRIRTQPFYFKMREDVDQFLKKIPGVGKATARAITRTKGLIKYLVMPGIIFEELGFKYLGPIDGHNIQELVKVFSRAKLMKGPVFIHVCTQKGKGYSYAEEKPYAFHGVQPFEIETGEAKVESMPSFSNVFGEELVRLAGKEPRLVAITAAMRDGTGLVPFSTKYRNRFFDVGIAEQHAVTLAAGMAANGLVPVFAVYSTFLQRAFDQVLHDVAIQNLHVVFAVDRAGLIGDDGETHQGLFDLSFLRDIPNITILAPCDYCEFREMLDYAVLEHNGPIAIRYPRGAGQEKVIEEKPVKFGKGVKVRDGKDVSIVAVGTMVSIALKAADELSREGISAEVINARFCKPLDEKLIITSAAKTSRIVTIEDNSTVGGFGSGVIEVLNRTGLYPKVKLLGFPDKFIEHGARSKLYRKYGLDYETVVSEVKRIMRK